MKQRRLISQGGVSRMLQAAEEAWGQCDFQKNIELLERASQLDPANPNILLQLGRVYGLRYDYAAAERCFEKAVRVSPRKTATLTTAALQCTNFANHQMAERYFLRAVEQKEATPDAFARFAELYERINRMEEASSLVERALQMDSRCALALLTRARFERQAGQLEEAERVLRSFLPTAEREIKIRGYYELGGNLDRQGRYDDAMTAFLEAKALLRSDAPRLLVELQWTRSYVRQLLDGISTETLQRWFDAGAALQPARRLAFLGGHVRSGTTLLEQVLDSHPDIVSAEETTIFHDAYVPLMRRVDLDGPMLSVLDSAPAEELQKARASFFQSMELHLGNPIRNRLLIDKNPGVNFLIPAFIRVFPEIKLLIALRDPRDVCMSCFMQPHFPIRTGSVPHLTLQGTVEGYTHIMGMWARLAPLLKNPYLEIRYEDVVDDLESVSHRVLDFLGVPWDARVLRFNEHAQTKRVRSPSYADVKKPVFRRAMGRWRNYEKYFAPHLDKLAPFVKAFGYE